MTTLVATDVAARGLDLDDITHVINYDPPAEHKELRAPHRPHGPRRTKREGDHVRPARAAGRDEPRARRLGHSEQFEQAGLRSARPKLVYNGRRGRRSKW